MRWPEKALDELGFVGRGKSKHRPRDAGHLYGGPYPFIQTGDVKHSDLYVTQYSQTYSEAGLAQSKLWPSGTLCITIAANIAETAILGLDACFPDSIIGFVADESKSDARFIKYKLDTVKGQYRRVSQGVAQDNLSLEKLLSFKLAVPPPQTQRRIGSILSAYDDLIENNRRRMKLLEDAARLLYEEWFVCLRFPGHERVRIKQGVPEGWELRRVCNIGTVITGKTPGTRDSRNFGGNIPFIRTPDMHGNTFVIETEMTLTETGANTQPGKFVPPNSLLVSCIGTVGVVALTSSRAQFNQQINAVVPFDDTCRYYYYFALKGLGPKMEALGGGATMANVSKSKFEAMEIQMPSKPLLREFHEFCTPLFDQFCILAKQNQRLRAARDLLLPRLMSGEAETVR